MRPARLPLGPRLQLHQTNWSFPTDIEMWIHKQAEGLTLNFSCGTSFTGDVRVDLDKTVRPHVIADLNHPPFRDQSFDTVICDPPYSFYNRFKWVNPIANLARHKVLFSSPLVALRLQKDTWEKSWHVCETNTMFVRLWQIFIRKQTST